MLVILIAYRQATVGENLSAKGRLPFDFQIKNKNWSANADVIVG
jgi:hypothetical protein